MTREEIEAFLKRFVELWQRADARALAASYTDQATVVSPLLGRRKGRDEVEASYRDLFRVFAEWRIAIDELLIDSSDPRAVLLTSAQATHVGELFGYRGRNQRFTLKTALTFEFDNGRIGTETRLYDFAGLLVELGVLTAKKKVHNDVA